MNFKDMLDKLTVLSEETKETSKGRVHKGKYGTSYQPDEKRDEYGHRMKGTKAGPDIDPEDDEKKPEKRGRGRPTKAGSSADTAKKYSGAKDLQSHIVGNIPKKSKALEKLPKKKHTLKDWFESLDKAIMEAGTPGQQLQVKPMQGAAQLVDPATGKIVATGRADKIKALQGSVTQGDVQMPGKMEEAGEGQKWIKGAIKHPGAFTKKAKAHGMTPSAFASKVLANKEDYPAKTEKQAVLAKTLGKMRKKTTEADLPGSDYNMLSPVNGANLGEAKKPDFPDIDNDKNRKEPISKAAQDAKKKKKMNESMHKHNAAKLLGKHHALAKEGYNCKYDDMEEARMYHEGYKEGLDECYGQMPIQGLVGETAPPAPAATVPGMANQAMPAMEDDMEEGNAFTEKLRLTPKGGEFKLGNRTYTDRSNYEESLAFESFEKQLNELLVEGEKVEEGISISSSVGNQGAPDTVSVTGTDGDAEKLMALIKSMGVGFADKPDASGYGAPMGDNGIQAPVADVEVVDDHDDMMALIKKMSGGEPQGQSDYEPEDGHQGHEEHGDEEHGHEEHTHEETCHECGYMESDCKCDEEAVMGEDESEDQMTDQVAEETPQQAGQEEEEETTADENAEAEEDKALAMKSMKEGSDGGEASEEDEKEPMSETSFFNLYKKLSLIAEESTKKEDEKAEKAGEEVTKDIEYDDKKDKKKKVDEWANQAGPGPGKGTDAGFEQDIDFMTKVIAGGLNKPKSTGQTTIPVIPGQEARMGDEDVKAWKKLAGL